MTIPPKSADPDRIAQVQDTVSLDSDSDFSTSPQLLSFLASIATTLNTDQWIAATMEASGQGVSKSQLQVLHNSSGEDVSILHQMLLEDRHDRKLIDRSGLHPSPYYATFYRDASFTVVLRLSPDSLLGARFCLLNSEPETKSAQLHHAEAALQALARFSGRPYDPQGRN